MKGIFVATLLALAVNLTNAHYTFPSLIVGSTITSNWTYVRLTDNHYSNGPVTDVTDPNLKCYDVVEQSANVTSTYTVAAGSTLGFAADTSLIHPGPLMVYMSAADTSLESAGSGTTWFKIFEDLPVYTDGALVFPSVTRNMFTFTLPASLPNGQYLVRAEQIALHVAETYGGAQFYIGCGQINVVNGGSGTPGPLVAFPGAYTGYEPGLLIDIWQLPANYTGYVAPGPPVWPSSGGGSTTTTSKATTTTTTAATTSKVTTTTTSKATTTTTSTASGKTVTTTTTTKVTTTSSAPGATQTEYGQCGGQGYTGPTVCASPYTCTYSSAYYSQCV